MIIYSIIIIFLISQLCCGVIHFIVLVGSIIDLFGIVYDGVIGFGINIRGLFGFYIWLAWFRGYVRRIVGLKWCVTVILYVFRKLSFIRLIGIIGCPCR